LRLREKLNLKASGELSGKACFSALRDIWRRLSSGNPARPIQTQATLARDAGTQTYSPELHGLLGMLRTVRQRVLANSLLRGWTKWSMWVLAGLIAVGAVSSKLAGALLLVAVLAVAGAAAIFAWAWRTRLSTYDTARRLDSAAGLKDRVSTAIYLGGAEDPDGMIGQQRRDALVRAAKIDPRGLFAVRLPAKVGRAGALILVVAGLFTYRIHHKPPLVSLLQTTARSQLVQSIFSPIVHAMEKDLQRSIALVTMKPDAIGDETRRGDSASGEDDLWKGGDDKTAAEKQEPPDSADAGDQPQDQLQPPGDPEANPNGEARQEDGNSQSQEGKNGNDSTAGKSQQPSEQQGAESRQSLGQSLMQALKNMLSNSSGQQSSNRASRQPPNAQGAPQSGNSQQPGATDGDKRGESRGSSDAKQKATQTASEGAGSQQGSKELRKDSDAHPVNAVPDRVALEASGFKEQTRMNVTTETGTAQLATRDQAPDGDAVINGAEQETIPARYRLYIQHYFEHVDNGKP
jgi:hypothetical protein